MKDATSGGPHVLKLEAGTYWWCACGQTSDQPFCDGSHKGTGLAPKKVELTEPQAVAFCGCRQSGDAPYCDGSHSEL